MANLTIHAGQLLKSATKTNSSDEPVYEKILFVNNAGSLGPLGPIGTQNNTDALSNLSKSLELNITSSCYLTTELMRLHRSSHLNGKNLVIVNISSLAAIQPFESWAVYCAGKAARDMFHQVLASETEKDAAVSVLNYAPGPLDTDMGAEIRNCETLSPEIRSYFQSLKKENKYVLVKDSAEKLVRLLTLGLFVSGNHIDYFDHVGEVDSFDNRSRVTIGNPKTDTKEFTATKTCCSGCGDQCNCASECKCASSNTSEPAAAAVVGGCTSCGCSSACGPECKCASSNTSKPAAASVVGGCTSCGCSSACGPECKCVSSHP